MHILSAYPCLGYPASSLAVSRHTVADTPFSFGFDFVTIHLHKWEVQGVGKSKVMGLSKGFKDLMSLMMESEG